MSKQLKLDDEARAMVRALGAKLLDLGNEQDVIVWSGRFELSVVEKDAIWFSYHPSYYYLDDPQMGKRDESTVSESEQLSATES